MDSHREFSRAASLHISSPSRELLTIHSPSSPSPAIPVPSSTSSVGDINLVNTKSNVFARYIRPWGLEIFMWFLAMSLIIALMVIFKVYNHSPVRITALGVELPTVVAVVSSGARAALLAATAGCISQLKWLWMREKQPALDMQVIDDASRGALGSIVLLLKRRGGPLLWLGSVIMILTLALAAFSQEALFTELIPQPATDGAWLNRAVIYRALSMQFRAEQYVQGDSPNRGPTVLSVPAGMRAAILEGMESEDISSQAGNWTCPTGNCTWPPYISLAVCAGVEEVSKTLVRQCQGSDQTQCGQTVQALIDDPPFGKRSLSLADDEVLFVGTSEPREANSRRSSYEGSNTLLESYVINHRRSRSEIDAFKITLSLCLQRFNTTIVSAQEQTIVDHTFSDVNFTLRSNSGSAEDLSPRLEIIGTEEPGTSSVFGIGPDAFHMLQAYLGYIVFTGVATLTPDGAPGRRPGSKAPALYTTDTAQALRMTLADREATVNRAAALHALQSQMDRLAVSMTNSLRLTASRRLSLPGRAEQADMVQYAVNYRWMAFPLSLAGLTLTLLFCTIFLTANRRVPVWKSDQMPLLYGLISDVERPAGCLADTRELKRSVKDRKLNVEEVEVDDAGERKRWETWTKTHRMRLKESVTTGKQNNFST